MKDVLERAARVRLVVFDVDGVLTDGSLFFGDDGEEYKAFHARDGQGMAMLREAGVEIGVISGRTSRAVTHRMSLLHVVHVYQGQQDKLAAFEDLLGKLGLTADQAAFVGDDVIDLPILRRAGLAIAVADAHPLVARHAHWKTPSAGGRGAGRDVCELILEAQGQLEALSQRYLR